MQKFNYLPFSKTDASNFCEWAKRKNLLRLDLEGLHKEPEG